ncbi:MAG: glycosyltransferase [Nitrospirales bacterium]
MVSLQSAESVGGAVARRHVVFVVRTSELGGAEKHLLALIARLDRNLACTILCYGPDLYSARLSGRAHTRMLVRKRIESASVVSMLMTFIRLRASAIVFIKGCMDEFGLGSYVAARLSGAERVLAIEHLVADPLPSGAPGRGIVNFLRQSLGWRARRVWATKLQSVISSGTICVSEAVREILVSDYGYLPDSTVTVLNGVDLKHFQPAGEVERARIREVLGFGLEEVIIVCVARLSPRKRIDLLLDSLALLPKTNLKWNCLILGSGPLNEELRARSAGLDLAAAVQFVGFIEDIKPYLMAGDLYVSPSDKEGFPLTLLEAMACGLPCVATKIGGHDEIVVHDHTGLLVPPRSVEELARALELLLRDSHERRRKGLAGRQRVEELFDIDPSMDRIQKTILGMP